MPANGSTALTGRNATFTVDSEQVARATNWDVNEKIAHVSEWGDSDSNGFTCRAAGRKDATFAANGKYDTDGIGGESFGMDLFHPDDTCHAELDSGEASSSTSLAYDFPRALCNDFKISVNIDSEEVIGWTSEWGADGEFTGYAIVPQS